MRINTKLVKTVQKIWNRDWIQPGLDLGLTDEQSKGLVNTLIQWKVYDTLNQKEKNQ